MYFSFHNILPIAWVALGVALCAIIYLLTYYRHFTRLRYKLSAQTPDNGECDGGKEIDDASLPSVSVIIYTRDNAEDLRRMLPAVLAQDYPLDKLDVIVVNDGSVEDVTDVVNYLSTLHSNLYITYVPDEARNLSRKKLAVSLGVKAARGELVLHTTAEATPSSPQWVRHMMRHFALKATTDVVLGWADIEGVKSSSMRFDQVAVGTAWLSAALHGFPYRGTGYNLAYRRQLFFDAKGFSRTLNLHHGDDDLFVNQITTPTNTAVCLSPDARMDVNVYDPAKLQRELRLRHCFTGRRLPRRASMVMASGTWALWVWVAATTIGVVFSLPNWWPSCLFAATIPMLWIPLTINWMRTARTLNLRLNPWLLWWQMLWRWTTDLKYRMECGSRKRRNYTWHNK